MRHYRRIPSGGRHRSAESPAAVHRADARDLRVPTDMMAAALASQRQASDRAIEERRKAQQELDESARKLEEAERLAREIYEGLRKLEKGSGAQDKGDVEIPDSM
jgi:hypothetical protein